MEIYEDIHVKDVQENEESSMFPLISWIDTDARETEVITANWIKKIISFLIFFLIVASFF